jgi:hypothetical protein
MMPKPKPSLLAAGVLAVPVLAAPVLSQPAASGTAWLHVRVEEGASKKVHVNLPLAVVEAVLEAAPDTIGAKGRVHLGEDGLTLGRHRHMSVADMKRIWGELKAAGDTEIVTVEDDDETVRVERKGDLVQVRVQRQDRREGVHVDVPVAVVDALLSAEGEGLDVRAGIAEIKKLRGDLVRVHDDEATVRVWIDENAGSSGGR